MDDETEKHLGNNQNRSGDTSEKTSRRVADPPKNNSSSNTDKPAPLPKR